MRALLRGLVLAVCFVAAACCSSDPRTSPCLRDSDCQAFDDYCISCACVAATRDHRPAACEQPACVTVQALCHDQVAVCAGGTCELRSVTPAADGGQ